MPDDGKGQVFISHTHADQALAEALQDLIKALFGNQVVVSFSTNKEFEGRIKAGQDWYRWIVDTVRECDVALILLTPASVQKPWILWESGAVYGVAEAVRRSDQEITRVRPLVFHLSASEVPSPFQRMQTLAGDSIGDMEQLMEELLAIDFERVLNNAQRVQAARKLASELTAYKAKVTRALLDAPLTITEAAVQEWLQRIESLRSEKRVSEVDHLHGWLRVAFGREADEAERPIDLRIHRRLGDMYQAAKNTKKALAQFELARRLAPRDLYLLRKLGQLYLDDGDHDAAAKIVARIRELDPTAFEKNQECAALEGRWLSEVNRYDDAATVYGNALRHNTRSYYLCDLLGQVYLRAGRTDKAVETYRQATAILSDLAEQNLWTHATAATAAIVCNQEDSALEHLRAVRTFRPTASDLESIERGLRGVRDSLKLKDEVFERWRNALRP